MRGKSLSTQVWTPRTLAEAEATLLRVLAGAGDTRYERLFRMQITLCLHRALTADEISILPSYFHTDPAVDLAGGPVEILRETEPGWETTKPCHQPVRHSLDPRDPLLWFPLDCGDCPPCLARQALDDQHDRKVGAAKLYLADQFREVGVS